MPLSGLRGAALVLIFLGGASCSGPDPAPSPGPGDPSPTKKPGMTFYRDVLPIMQQSCQGCHVAGGIAPFPLSTYMDAFTFHAEISSAVQHRLMPPWMPSDACQSFRDARRLTQDQIDTIYSWSADGAPQGDPKDAPPPPGPAAELPWIDATLDAGADYTPPQKLSTDYHCFLLDPKLGQDRDLVGYDVLPGARKEVHHVLLYPADAAEAQALDQKEPGVGWTCFGGPGTAKTQTIGGWVPGSPPTQFPPDTGITLKAGQVLIMQIHYNIHDGSSPVAERTQVKLQFARQPVARHAEITALLNASFSIPPGSTGYSATARLSVPADLTLYGLLPHEHTLGQSIRVGTDTTCLIDIPRWDFSWQQMYFYANPAGMHLKRGTPVTLTCTWNNPGPAAVSWGESTADEMCLNYFYTTVP